MGIFFKIGRQVIAFLSKLFAKIIEDELFSLASELAYKILLSFFPFLVFLVSVLGFLNLQDSPLVYQLFEMFPEDIAQVIVNFMVELTIGTSGGLLSGSLLISVFSASNGFRAVMRGVNKAHGFKEERGFFKSLLLSIGLTFIFAFSLVSMLALWVFGNNIVHALRQFFDFDIGLALQATSAAVAFVALVVLIALVYRLACVRRTVVLPGALTTVLLWAVSSSIFSLVIDNVVNFSMIYGSIAGVFILIIWLNLIALFLLLGNTINSIIHTSYPAK
ncbi:MAG: YihY/virulence factor BrkB family protein [Defluviitaleaceae bacterium]|nr:YihY/virulence factor BrkB family protein [Defluviitaleaceae bacterium]